MCAKGIGKHAGVSLLLECQFNESNSDYQAWPQAPFIAKPAFKYMIIPSTMAKHPRSSAL